MGHALHDLIRHNSWANRQLLAFCGALDETALNATVPGTYGTVIETLRHIISSERSYLFRASGALAPHAWRHDDPADLALLVERAALLATAWEEYIASDVDPERLGEARGDEGEVYAVPSGVFITQAIHHGNEHRTHICTILGALGHEAPELSGWLYAETTGRMTLKTPASS